MTFRTPAEKTRCCKTLHKSLYGPIQLRIDKALARLAENGGRPNRRPLECSAMSMEEER
jgi:hypothetical protein